MTKLIYMKIELDYIKELLSKAQSSEKAIFTIYDLVNEKSEIDSEKFVFHLRILADQAIIVADKDNGSDMGDSRYGNGLISWTIRNLRMTNKGHDFIDALQNQTIFNKLKTEVKSKSLVVIEKLAISLLTKYSEQALGI